MTLTKLKELRDRVRGLSDEQRVMVRQCLAFGASWITSPDGDNFRLLTDWQEVGLVEEVAAPVGSLVAYRFTEHGSATLTALIETME